MTQYDTDEIVYINHDGIKHETEKAKLFNIGDNQIWIPKSIIEDEDDGVIIVKRWWASKNGIGGDW